MYIIFTLYRPVLFDKLENGLFKVLRYPKIYFFEKLRKAEGFFVREALI